MSVYNNRPIPVNPLTHCPHQASHPPQGSSWQPALPSPPQAPFGMMPCQVTEKPPEISTWEPPFLLTHLSAATVNELTAMNIQHFFFQLPAISPKFSNPSPHFLESPLHPPPPHPHTPQHRSCLGAEGMQCQCSIENLGDVELSWTIGAVWELKGTAQEAQELSKSRFSAAGTVLRGNSLERAWEWCSCLEADRGHPRAAREQHQL